MFPIKEKLIDYITKLLLDMVENIDETPTIKNETVMKYTVQQLFEPILIDAFNTGSKFGEELMLEKMRRVLNKELDQL